MQAAATSSAAVRMPEVISGTRQNAPHAARAKTTAAMDTELGRTPARPSRRGRILAQRAFLVARRRRRVAGARGAIAILMCLTAVARAPADRPPGASDSP